MQPIQIVIRFIYNIQVGGPEFSKVIKLLRMDGRAAVCGAISQYNSTEPVFSMKI